MKKNKSKTLDEEKQIKNTTQYVLDTNVCKQIQQITYKQLEVKTNRTSICHKFRQELVVSTIQH